MSGEMPRCRRERLTIDLNDLVQRRAVYEANGSAPALMITEGLLLYLPAATVEALAAESFNRGQYPALDYRCYDQRLQQGAGKRNDTMKPIRHVQASDALNGEGILGRTSTSWLTTSSQRSYITDVGFLDERLRRMMGGATPPPLRYPPGDPTGVHRFVHG